jgi:hypothetical protein
MGKGPLFAIFSLTLIAALATVDAQVGSRRLTVDDIYNPTRRINFGGTAETGVTRMRGREYVRRLLQESCTVI